MSPQTAIEDRPAEAAPHGHPGLSKVEATAVHPQELVECTRCAELRAASGLSLQDLAKRAIVPTKVIFDLEHGLWASRTHARAVLRVLTEAGASVGGEADELIAHRFLPNCRTLREKVRLKQNRLAALAGVDADLIKNRLERGKSGRLTDVESVFQVLRQHHQDLLGTELDWGEIRFFPSDLPRPRLGPDGQGPTDTLSQDAVQSPTSPLPVALAPSDHEPKPAQSEPDIPPPEQMPDAAPTVHEARLDPGNEDGQPIPNPIPVPTPDAEEGIGQPDPTNRADVEPADAPAASADVVEAAATEALGPENGGDPPTDNGPGPRGD